MYVVLGIMFLLVFWAGALLGQQRVRPVDDQETDAFTKRMKMREEIHKRMMDKLLRGIGPDQDMFTDMESMMNDLMSESFSGLQSFSNAGTSNYKMEWKESSSGRALEITPSSPEQQLDINVANGMITIKGKAEQKSQNGSYISNFSNSFNVPGDCDEKKVKMDQKDGKIIISFPYYSSKPQEKKPVKAPERIPLPPSQDDVQI